MRLFLCLKWVTTFNQQNSENKKAEYNFVSAFYHQRIQLMQKIALKVK